MAEEIKGFNTGRLYSKMGQRVSYQVLEDGTVLFNDHDRMIAGALRKKSEDPKLVTPRYIMHEYDRYEYGYDARATALDADEHGGFGDSLRI